MKTTLLIIIAMAVGIFIGYDAGYHAATTEISLHE